MNIFKKALFAFGLAGLVFTACNDNDDDDFKLGDKEGTVLVTFGSSYEAPQQTFATMGAAAKAKFPNEEIRWGYTSDLILNILRQGNGENGIQKDNDTPQEAITNMIKEGYSKFTVQSLHVIPGEEYEEMIEKANTVKKEYPDIEISFGKPLLDSDEDLQAVAEVLNAKFATELSAGPVIFMGHGTPHEADGQYTKLETKLKALNTNFFVGTVEGIGFDADETSIGGILNKIPAGTTNITISPLMSIAGDHANNDMAGVTGETDPAEQSWKERLEAAGYIVNIVMKGLGDYAEINAIWMDHLNTAMNK
ncbi:sirohydrochlorin cobaltochelatase [Plebeiibacterium marinum]|uniref:Sirohydrochlorin cobaltochelatase n=1 Tax=Plebeiibacterium marinum TaxID=2992111 RepID=A0AAE3MGI8_9BACT|nr:sirohydrochlorin cobaltochelatase [Plebeiobacterium marinum]MCW3807164.1 sirohydrochlorin cobaltochelatase [Plebeiobacterium marinum]